MAIAGNSYTVEIKQAHLEWGSHRHTNTRGIVYGEGYIHIPSEYASHFNIFNSNYNNGADVLGINIFNCSSVDGFFNNTRLKAAGCSRGGNTHAKQFQGNRNLKAIGDWYHHVGAQVGDIVKVTWTSPNDILIELL